MELPRLIVVGENNLNEFGEFLFSLNKPKKISLISGINVKKILKNKIERSLKFKKIKFVWHTSKDNQINSLNQIQKDVKKDRSDIVVGIGGGRSVDTAKLVSFNLDLPFVSVPTAASHDGMASPFVSVKSDKPHSIVASAPLGVFVDIDVIKKAPTKLLSSGCGDLISNIIAVKDWQLGHEKTGEYYGMYSADLAMMSAKIVMENSSLYIMYCR
jgi:glycerol-1-phosphate dehydrogenase [NAD(P)+]